MNGDESGDLLQIGVGKEIGADWRPAGPEDRFGGGARAGADDEDSRWIPVSCKALLEIGSGLCYQSFRARAHFAACEGTVCRRCHRPERVAEHLEGDFSMSFYVGEALVGEGNEIAHIDLLIGDKTGPVGVAFANALSDQKAGHSNLLAVLTPNLAVKPATVMITKVTIKGAKQAVQMFGPAQFAVAKAVADSVEAGVIPKDQAEKLVIVCGVFIHWEAKDDKKIFEYNYEATKLSIARAMKNEPSVDEMLAKKDTAKHPFSGLD